MSLLLFRTSAPRAAPWPADALLGGVPLMLGTEAAPTSNKDDLAGARMVSGKPEDQQKVIPSDFGYSAQNPILDPVHSWTDMSLGYGLRIQEGTDDRRYRYALRADLTVQNQWIKGPDITQLTPATTDSTNGVKRKFELNSTLYFLVGRYCLQRVSDSSFTVAQDFGAGQVSRDVSVFANSNVAGGQYAYIAMGDSCAVWRAGPRWAIQNVAISGTPTGGTYILSYGGVASAPISYAATAGAVQSALQVIPGLEGVSVTLIAGVGSANATFAVSMNGVSSPSTLVPTDSMTGGSHAIAVTVATSYTAVEFKQRVMEQTLTIAGGPTLGTYVLRYGTTATAAIAYNASAATVRAALRLISGLENITVTSTGDTPNFTHTIVFTGVNNQTTTLVVDAAGVTGGTFTMAQSQNVLRALAFAVTGRQFYRGHQTNQLALVDIDSDPFQEANWSAPNQFAVGDKSFAIQRLVVTVNGTLVTLKTDGPYTIDQGGNDWMLVPHLHGAQDPAGGEPAGYFTNDIYFTYGNGGYRLNPQMQLEEIGPERLTGNNSPIQGRMTAYAGHDSFNLYGGIWNQDTGAAYLMKFGAWINMGRYGNGPRHQSDPTPRMATRQDVWHGSISQAFTSQITLLDTTTIGAPAAHKRLIIGFLDGTFAWFDLPCQPNPAACSDYRFTTSDAQVWLPTWHGGFMNDAKALRAFDVDAEELAAANYVTIAYNTDPAGSTFTGMPGPFNAGPQRLRVEFPNSANCDLMDVRVTMVSALNTHTPKIWGVALHSQLRTLLYQVLTMYVLAEDGLQKRNGTPYRWGAKKIRDFIVDCANSPASFQLVLPDEQYMQVSVIDYQDSRAWDWRNRRWRSSIKVTLGEVVTGNVYGTYDRLSIYTYSAMESFTYSGLQTA